MSEPLAYLLTWTTYATWLPGDERGWVEGGEFGIKDSDRKRVEEARKLTTESPVILDAAQRTIVEATIREHCAIRGWRVHAVNVRTNHVHVVVTAGNIDPDSVMSQFKAWCSRRLNEQTDRPRKHWWTKGGSTKWINDTEYLNNAIHYVAELQG